MKDLIRFACVRPSSTSEKEKGRQVVYELLLLFRPNISTALFKAIKKSVSLFQSREYLGGGHWALWVARIVYLA